MYKSVTRPLVYTFRLTAFVFPVYSYLVISVTLDGVTLQLLAPLRYLWRKLRNRAAML